jgi:hypothetical protein
MEFQREKKNDGKEEKSSLMGQNYPLLSLFCFFFFIAEKTTF